MKPDLTREEIAKAVESCLEQGGYLVLRFNHSQMRQLREAETTTVLEALKAPARPEVADTEHARLRAIIRQAIWDLELKRPDMAIIALRYAGVEESAIPGPRAALEPQPREEKP